jgi:hypothetical protein
MYYIIYLLKLDEAWTLTTLMTDWSIGDTHARRLNVVHEDSYISLFGVYYITIYLNIPTNQVLILQVRCKCLLFLCSICLHTYSNHL